MTTAADRHKLTPEERRTLERVTRARETIRLFLNGDPKAVPPRPPFDDDHIADLIRRAREPAVDPYTQGSGGRGNDVSRPTESAVLRDAGGHDDEPDLWREPADPIREHLLGILAGVSEAAGVLRLATKRRYYVEDLTAKATKRINTVDLCAGCNEPIVGKTKRFDGQPYHHPNLADPDLEPNCWWVAVRAGRPPSEQTA